MNRILSDILIIGTFSIATSSTTSNPIIYTTNTGNVGIGTSTPTTKLYIKGSDSTSSNHSLKIDNSSNSLMFSVRNDGFVLAGNSSANSYLWVNGLGGQLGLTSENTFSYLLLNSANNKFYISNGSSGNNTFAQINTSNGNWLIGSPNTSIYTANLTDTKFTIQSVDSGSSNYALKINNSSNNELLYVRNDGNVGIGTSSLDNTRLYIRQISTSSTTWGVRSESTGNSILTGETFQGTVFAYSASASNGSQNIGYFATIKDNRTSNRVTANYGGLYLISGTAQNNRGLYLNVSEAQDYNYGVDSVIGGTHGSIHMNFSAANSANMFGQKYGLNVQLSGSSNNSTGIEVSVSGGSENYSIRTGYGVSEFNYLNDINSDFKIRGSSENNLFFADSSANSIGVRTQNPSYSLHVLGTVSTTGFRMTNGASSSYLMISDSQGNASWTASSNLNIATGSGTVNYLPKWTSTNTLSSTSSIYNEQDIVMIGTNSTSNIINSYGYSSVVASRISASAGELTYGFISLPRGKGQGAHPATIYGQSIGYYSKPTGDATMYGFYAQMTDYRAPNYGFYSFNSASSSINTGYSSVITNGDYNYGIDVVVNTTDTSGALSTNVGARMTVEGGSNTNTGLIIDSDAFGIRVYRGTSLFNEFANSNTDFQIQGSTQPYLFFADASTDNIGIKTENPSYSLHVIGTVSTTGFRMTNGSATNSILRSNGDGDATWVTLSSLNIATGSGTSNYLPRWTSTTTLSSTSSLYDDSVDVGIATTSVGRGRLSIVPRGASAAVYISNTTNNSYITYRANTATYSMGVDYDATNPYFAISGGPSSYTTGALGSFDRMRLYNDSMHLIINATSSTVGPASVSNIRKGELVISNFNSISSAHTGKAYTSVILVGGTTTTNIARELKTDGVTASSNKITIPTDTTSAFVVNIQGQSDSNPTTCYFATIRGLVQNYTSSLTILGSTTSVVYNDMSGSASVSVDGTSLQILAQTTTSQIARWVARVEMTTLTQIGEIP